MGRFDEEYREAIFERSRGLCHLCGEPMARSNYGIHGARGAWEIDHSLPRACGGSDHGNNLRAAHIDCNRSKQARSSASVRRANGLARPPMSAAAMQELKAGDTWVGALAFGMLGARFFGPPGLVIGAILGAIGAYAVEREG